MTDTPHTPSEPSPFVPDEADAPRNPKTGAVEIDEPDVADPAAGGDDDRDDGVDEQDPARERHGRADTDP
jgi:hypothetical protein